MTEQQDQEQQLAEELEEAAAADEATPDAAEDTTEAADAPEQDAGDQDDQVPDDGSRASRQAARYRTRAKDAEAQRDQLQDQVTALRQQLAAGAVADVVTRPESLWTAGGLDVSDFVTESGGLDVESLRTAAGEVAEQVGLATPKRFQGTADGGARQESPPPERDPFDKAADTISRSR